MRYIINPAVLLCLLLVSMARSGPTETADDIIARNIAARGGLEKIKSIQSMRTMGKLTIAGAGMDGKIVAQIRRPNMSRVDFTIGGMEGYRAYDGTMGW